MLHGKTSIGRSLVSMDAQWRGVTRLIDRRIICRPITPIRLDRDPSIVHIANPDVSEAPSVDGTCSDDPQVPLSQPPVNR